MTHFLSTWRDADAVEALDSLPCWRFDPVEVNRFHVGDDVVVTTSDRAEFIGYVADVSVDDLQVRVALG